MKILSFSIIMISLLLQSLLLAGDFNHGEFDQLLQKYVRQGRVDYRTFLTHKNELKNYLNKIEQMDKDAFGQWDRSQKMSFWINAYNAITIYGILENYPIQHGSLVNRVRFPQNSIRQIGDFWNKIWIKPLGEEISLNKIEHEILRKKFKDPRIHFALVCASIGCPDLQSRVFLPQTLDKQLDAAARKFMNDPQKVKLDRQKKVLFLSSLLDWYHEDFPATEDESGELHGFPAKYAGLIKFITGYLPEDAAQFIFKNKPKIKFMDYDWTLNENE